MSEMSETPKLPLLLPFNGLHQEPSTTSRLFDDRQKRLDMGPRWSEEELDIFLTYFRQSGLKEITTMQEKLEKAGYKRSIENLQAVFLKNKNFLTYNPTCAARDLSAIMADHYETMETEVQIMPERPAVKPREPVSESTLDRKRNLLGLNSKGGDFLDEPTKARHYEDPLSHKRKFVKVPKNQYSSDESSEFQANSNKPTKKIYTGNNIHSTDKKKPRKSLMSKGKFPLEFDFNDQDLLKNCEIASRTCTGKSVKRNGNFSLRKSNTEKNYSPAFLKFLDCEAFYSTLDEPFFAFNDFHLLLNTTKENRKMTLIDWGFLRSCLGKPRRFSNEFVKSQLQDLSTYRSITRSYLQNHTPLPENMIHPNLAQRIKCLKPLQVSQIVLAVHPQCNHIHAGSILTISGRQVIIKFFPSELGATGVLDCKVKAVSQEAATQIMDYFNGSNLKLTGIPMNRSMGEHDGDKEVSQNKLIQDLDFNALALFIKMMERKAALVKELKHFNDIAENDNKLEETFYQEYGWTGIQIKLIDNALKHVVTKTRLRGLNNYDVEQISNSLDVLMSNPLKALAELERRSSEDIDPKIIKEIKDLLHKNIDQKINEQIKGLTDKYSRCGISTERSNSETLDKTENTIHGQNGHHIKEEEIKEQVQQQHVEEKTLSLPAKKLKAKIIEEVNETEKKDLKKMVDNMMGVILSLKLSGDVNMTENRYLNDLHNHIFEGNSEEFHEINNVLLNICSK